MEQMLELIACVSNQNMLNHTTWKEYKDKILNCILELRDMFQNIVHISSLLSSKIHQRMVYKQRSDSKLEEEQMLQISEYSQAVSTNAAVISEMVDEQNIAWQGILGNDIVKDDEKDKERMVTYLVEQVQLVLLAMENVIYKHSILECVE